MLNPNNFRLPTCYGDLPNFPNNIANQTSEEDQSALDVSQQQSVLRSEASIQSTDNEQQFWADNELESQSSSVLNQVSGSLLEKQCFTSRPRYTAKVEACPSRKKPMVLIAMVPSSSGRDMSSRTHLNRKESTPSHTSSSSSEESSVLTYNGSSKNVLLPCATSKTSQASSSSQLCFRCRIHPWNAVFVHGSIGHQCCCYHCALKLWKTKRNCPMCHKPIRKIVKIVTPVVVQSCQ